MKLSQKGSMKTTIDEKIDCALSLKKVFAHQNKVQAIVRFSTPMGYTRYIDFFVSKVIAGRLVSVNITQRVARLLEYDYNKHGLIVRNGAGIATIVGQVSTCLYGQNVLIVK